MGGPIANSEFENWDVLRRFLPLGWEEQARLCGAMRRARYIKSPETVLRILLLHLANGCSLTETAARAQASGLGVISSVGVFKRLRAGGAMAALVGAAGARCGGAAPKCGGPKSTRGGCDNCLRAG